MNNKNNIQYEFYTITITTKMRITNISLHILYW